LKLAGVGLAVAALAAAPSSTGPTPAPEFRSAAAKPEPASLYIVQMSGAPVASYEGGIAGIPRTKPQPGAKLDRRTWNYKAYREHLRVRRAAVLASAGVHSSRTVAEYATAFNGFAAKLTREEFTRIRRTAGVTRVWKNEIRHTNTVSTPNLLGLAGAGGAWAREFGDPARAGEGMIVGVVDTGYWPESPSFAPLMDPQDQAIINKKWFDDGIDKCEEGTEQRVVCNNKVIGARWYNMSALGNYEPEFHSPRDFNGHGSHTASTAAGNHAVPASINGTAIGNVSGMAPAARLAVYKALWQQSSGTGSGGTADLVMAIDDAVTDGVDVINFSVSGSTTYVVDPLEVAFFHAAAAGIFVAASAGNEGPHASTVAHNSPWATTVAASTHDRSAAKSATLGNGAVYNGVGQGPAAPSSPLVDSTAVGAEGADPNEVELCYLDSLDPAKVTGKIVLCRRGVNARTEKSKAVKDAGGVGMILYNPSVNSVNADYHFVPTVHVGPAEGAAIKAYIAGAASATAALSATVASTGRAPEMVAFSSAGPAIAGSGDLLKPDVTAPGADVIAAVAPPGNNGNTYDAYSGTSMSSPHVAGIAALIKAKHPDWSPMAVKSALMTTAGQTDNSGGALQRAGVAATPHDYGAGHIQPALAFDPGLVYDSGPADWIRFGCAIGQLQLVSDWCTGLAAGDPSDLNYPSISIGDLPGRQTVTRTVTNASNRASVYAAKVSAPTGYTVQVRPSVLALAPGRSATFTVQVTRTNAAYGTWSFGAMTWTDLRGHAVRSPIAVRAVALAAPDAIDGSGTSGSAQVTVRGGYNGRLTAAPYGLVTSTVHQGRLVGNDSGFDPGSPSASTTVLRVQRTAPAGSKVVRFATYDSDHAPGSDMDLYVYRNGLLVGVSAGGTSDETVTLTEPGTYDVYLVQFALPSGVTEQDGKLHSFVVPASSAGNMTVTPASQRISVDTTRTVTVRWSGLHAAKRYLGVVEFSDGRAVRARTTVAIGGTPS
jgi:subtilisin family serine protease